jgi:hypothetical protein
MKIVGTIRQFMTLLKIIFTKENMPMIQVPGQLISAYRMYLGSRGVKSELLPDYLKWLRFFLDFCDKYKVEGDESDRLRQFINKLKEKRQSEDQRRQAYHAVTLFIALQKECSDGSRTNDIRQSAKLKSPNGSPPTLSVIRSQLICCRQATISV